ncbi:MAG TPA: hypothetical protein VGF33_03035 [Caulobacteraceae bacterium]
MAVVASLSDLLKTLPASMARLPRDSAGRPIPWFVDLKAPRRNGDPDFRIMDRQHLKVAIRDKRCWVCGHLLHTRAAHEAGTFVAGPMCGVNRNSAEPPCHLACARWSAKACPFLSQPRRIRDDRGLPADAKVSAGFGILRNPGVTMLWTTRGYKTWRPPGGGQLFEIGEPSAVEWFCQGRAATRDEVIESLATGLPALQAQAELAPDPALASLELGRMVGEFVRYLPQEEHDAR